MVGRTISHYKIVEKVGEGGMGVVYKAEDSKLAPAASVPCLAEFEDSLLTDLLGRGGD